MEKTMDIRRTILVGATWVLTVLLAACATTKQDHPPAQSAALLDTEWTLISLNGNALIEGKEITLKANDILYIPSGEKHMTVNRGDNDFRYLEFFTCPPVMADFIEVK